MSTPRHVTAAATALLGAGLVLAALVTPHVALAHARYKTSTPGVGEIVQDSPTQVDITFTQNVQKVAGTYGMAVDQGGGGSVTSGPAVLNDQDRTQMSVPLQPNLPPGRYVVNWKNVSDDDGDPAEGAFSFYVRTQPTAANLANDQQLAQIGAEETPSANETPIATTRPAATSSAPSASPTAAGPSSSGGGSNTGLFIGIGVAVAIVLIAGGGWFTFMRSRP